MSAEQKDDHRVTCNTCSHFQQRNWRCINARMAHLQTRLGVTASDVGPELAALPQLCPGFKAKESK